MYRHYFPTNIDGNLAENLSTKLDGVMTEGREGKLDNILLAIQLLLLSRTALFPNLPLPANLTLLPVPT
jgi:hypothetical protein